MVDGILKCEIHPLTNALATVCAVISGMGNASDHLVNLSIRAETDIQNIQISVSNSLSGYSLG